ncbi:unnamed protein product [Ectocarpus sp. 6 AP-2014]
MREIDESHIGAEALEESGRLGYEFYRSIGSPTRIVAPMVDQSELAFRRLCRRYGSNLCYTPMYNSKCFAVSSAYRKSNFDPHPEDRPLIVQFCGHDPVLLLASAKFVEKECDAIDLNLGCPQGIARKGKYGAFLLEEWALLRDIVSTLAKNLSIPVTCKVRLLDSVEDTITMCKMLVASGARIITVHGRTKEQKSKATAGCNWDAIRRIKEALPVPVFSNGAISSLEDVERCLRETGCDGVMSSEGVLERPGLFSDNVSTVTGLKMSQDDIVLEYIDLAKQSPPHSRGRTSVPCLRGHMFKCLFTAVAVRTDLRARLTKARTLEEMEELALAVREARLADPESFDEEKTWYRRHTMPHTSDEWGTPQALWAAQAEVVAEKRLRDPGPEEVGLGDSIFGEEEGAGDY